MGLLTDRIELVASKSIEDAKELATSPLLAVDKRRYDSVVQNLVAAAIKNESLKVCDTNQSLQCLDLTGFLALPQF